MRILVAFAGGAGHFEPLVPLARAAAAAGHDIMVTGRPSMVPSIEAAGFPTGPGAGGAATGGAGAGGGPGAGDSAQRLALVPYEAAHEERVIREHFADRLARQRVGQVGALAAEWKPDLLICDEVDFGSMIAAEGLGLPYATVVVLLAGGLLRPEVVAEPLHRLRAEHGLPPDPSLRMLHRHLVISPVPPRFRDPEYPLAGPVQPIRPPVPEPPRADVLAAWPGRRPDAPIVHLTLGTEFNVESGDLFERALTGLRELPVNLLVTVGRQLDPAEFGRQPGHVRIERYIPQAAVLPHCALSVSHAGSGSVLGALAHGLPMVLLPMGADQPANAGRCVRLGVAQALDPVTATPETIRAAVTAVLADPGYRMAARRFQDEIATLPEPAAAVSRLEQLAGAGGD